MFWPGLLIALALLIAASWFLVRHIGLALLVALSPLPGVAIAALMTAHPLSILVYVPGFIAAAFLADAVARLAANAPAREAVQQTIRDLWPVFIAVLLLFAPLVFTAPEALCCIAGGISAVAVTALGAALFSYDENFVVRINRASEARLRQTERLDFLAQSRWGMSIGGITLVLSVLGFFGAQKGFATIPFHSMSFMSAAFLFVIGAFALARNIRRAAAAFLAMVPVTLLMSHSALLLLAVAAMPVLFMAAGAIDFERSGDNGDTATQRGIARFGPSVAVTMIASAAAVILSGWFSQTAIVEGAALLLGGGAALILQPALTTMLYSLCPKHVSLEDAFRKR